MVEIILGGLRNTDLLADVGEGEGDGGNHIHLVQLTCNFSYPTSQVFGHRLETNHYIISKSVILEINCSNIALLENCISQDTEPLQGAYDKI